MTEKPPILPSTLPATLTWRNNQPWSAVHGDRYCSDAGGLEEKHHVFVEGNDLPRRFARLAADSTFIIAELGFGLGLAFLATLACWRQQSACWRQQAPASARLHFFSFERYPLSHTELQSALQQFPSLSRLADELLQHWPQGNGGWHTLPFDDQVSLTLIIGDANQELAHCSFHADAWFLDGFAPEHNPELWQASLMQMLAQRSHASTTLSSYCVQRQIREHLQQAGFSIDKNKGYGRKRDMLHGQLITPPPRMTQSTMTQSIMTRPTMLSAPLHPVTHAENKSGSIAVIGAGLAGSWAARLLAERGYQVQVFERQHIASGGSGNIMGLLSPPLLAGDDPQACFTRTAFHFALQAMQRYAPQLMQQAGALHLTDDDNSRQRLQKMLASGHWQQDSMQMQANGLMVHCAGHIAPKVLCQHLLQHPNIRLHEHSSIQQLIREDGKVWQLHTENNDSFSADSVILANAIDALQLNINNGGQQYVLLADARFSRIRGTTAVHDRPAAVRHGLCGNGYLLPVSDNGHARTLVGATFSPDIAHLDDMAEDDAILCEKLQTLLQASGQTLASVAPAISKRSAFRTMTHDHLPVIGAAVDETGFTEIFSGLRDGKRLPDIPCPVLPGLYLSLGHGAHGLCYTPIAGETLARLINNEAMIMNGDAWTAIHPARFLMRAMKRK